MSRIVALSAATAAFMVLLAAAPGAQARPKQSASLPLPRIDEVVVEKGAKRLSLVSDGHVVRSYHVALGRYPDGPKTEEGDAKTPEGRYTLDARLPRSGFYKAIHISYPNEQDRESARQRGVRPGGKIMIHGIANGWSAKQLGHPWLNWTQGCIAVNNDEMDEIWEMVEVGTPIDIRP